MQHADELPPQIELLDSSEDEEVVPLLDNYEDLPASNDAYYMGGVNGGLGMGKLPFIMLHVGNMTFFRYRTPSSIGQFRTR